MSDTDDSTLPARADAGPTPRNHLLAAGRRLCAAAGSIGVLLLNATLGIDPVLSFASGTTPYAPAILPPSYANLLLVVTVVLWSFAMVMFGGAVAEIIDGLRLAVEQKRPLVPLRNH